MSFFDYVKSLKELTVSSFFDVLNFFKIHYNTIYVFSLFDLPFPDENNSIPLADNKTYYFVTNVDLDDTYLTAGQNTTILGYSSENCSITSSLQPGESLINSAWSLPIRNIALSVSGIGTSILNLDAAANANQALDWFGVNFTGGSVGTIANYTNFIMSDSSILAGSDGFTFDGTIGTIAFTQCLFSGFSTSGTYITLPSTLTVSRRFRVNNSSFVCTTGVTGINASTSATISSEGYILFGVNFSGGSTSYTSGITYLDDKALWLVCRGINNTSVIAQYYMQNNATSTTISVSGTYYKVAGTTTANTAINQKFTHSDNRLTYAGALTRNFKVTASISGSSGNNQNLKFRVAKNGTTDITSQSRQDTAGSGRVDNVVCQWLGSLATNDYIEIFTTNDTSTSAVTVEDLNVIIEEV
jgi:hypothetical protein